MSIRDETRDGVLVIHLGGRLDSNNSAESEKHIIGHITQGERRIVLNLSELDYVSSAGLRILLMGAKRIKSASGVMLLCGLKPAIREVLQISGFLAVLTVVDSCEEALRQAAG